MPTAYNSFNTISNASTAFWIFLIIELVIAILVIIAFFVAIKCFSDIAKDKGHRKSGLVWFLGIFATPIVAGLYTLQLRDLKKERLDNDSNAKEIQFYSKHLVAIEEQLAALQTKNPASPQPQASTYPQAQYQFDPQQQMQYQLGSQQQMQFSPQQQFQFNPQQVQSFQQSQ